jgi:hypothetical protein
MAGRRSSGLEVFDADAPAFVAVLAETEPQSLYLVRSPALGNLAVTFRRQGGPQVGARGKRPARPTGGGQSLALPDACRTQNGGVEIAALPVVCPYGAKTNQAAGGTARL